jgi:Rieske 2Fe-2S family protein
MAAQSGRSREERRAEVARLGLDPDAPRLPFRSGCRTQSMDGQPVAPLMGTHRDWDGTMVSTWIGDTFEMEANPDHVTVFRFTPLAPALTNVEVTWLVRGDAVPGRDYDRDRLTQFWKITSEQDWHICEVVQSGVTSRFYRPGPLSGPEDEPAQFLERYLAWLRDDT